MKQIQNLDNNHKYLYIRRENRESILYYIISGTYNSNHIDHYIDINVGFLLLVPKDSARRAIMYESVPKQFSINNNEKIYELNNNEFIDTYISFKKQHNRLVSKLDNKIIKDNI